MNKELEAFKRIKNHCEKDFIMNMLYGYEKDLKIVAKGLKRLESYDSLNLSCEELQFVSNILKNPNNSIKELKALGIIKENVFIDENGDIMPKNKGKTKEQIDLLKEVLL